MDLFISIFNRPEYVTRSLDSLLASFDVIKPRIIITDDASTDPEIDNLIKKFKKSYPNTVIEKNVINGGIPYGKLTTIKTYVVVPEYRHTHFLICDSDMIYKKGWVEILLNLYAETGAPLITGFNTLSNRHHITEEFKNYYIKESIGGCNLLVDTTFYTASPFFESKSWDYHMCERAHAEHGVGVVCSKPSLVDHIGFEGYWAKKEYYDSAVDF